MATSPEQSYCCSFNIFGCRLVWLLPNHQHGPVLTPEEASAAKKKRDASVRQALIVLYTVGGLLGGLALAASVLGAQEFRRPFRACSHTHYSPSPEDEEHCWPLLPSLQAPLEISDVILLANALATVLFGGVAIICVIDSKLHWLKWISVGFVTAILVQGAVTVVLMIRYDVTSNFQPYVPNKMLSKIEGTLFSAMQDYVADPVAQERWDYLQGKGCCCGLDGWRDWEEKAGMAIPESCYCKCHGYSDNTCMDWRCKVRHAMRDIGMCGNMAFSLKNDSVTNVGCMDPILRMVGHHNTRIMQFAYVVFFGLMSLQFVAALAPVILVCRWSGGTLPTGRQAPRQSTPPGHAPDNKYTQLVEDSLISDLDTQSKPKDGFEA